MLGATGIPAARRIGFDAALFIANAEAATPAPT